MRAKAGSLRLRVTLLSTMVVAVVLAGSSFMLVHWLRASQLDDADHGLTDQIDLVADLIQRGSLPTVLKPTGVNTGQVQVVTGSGTMVAVSPGLAATVRLDVFPAPALGVQEAHTTDAARLGTDGHDRFRVVARTVPSGIGNLTIFTASSLHSGDRAVRNLAISLWTALPVLVLLAAAATWFLTGRALRPVDKMRREVDAIQGSRPDQRLAPDRRADELDRLADTLNGMLDRISAAEATRRQFLADASHELRSPLASARTMLEVGLAYPARTDWPETAGEVMVELERLQDMAGELLALARAEGGERALSRQQLDLGRLVAGEVQRCGDERIAVHVDAPLAVDVDRSLYVRAVRNLLDNARRHARDAVDVSVSTHDGCARVSVRNDGPPVPADQLERIFEPFTRLDDARARDDGGAGLGLSIARRIAEVHGGALVATPLTAGAEFVLDVPRVVEP